MIVTSFGAAAAFLSIMVHFHFDKKSLMAIKKNLPSLSIIVSTKEGLETFLKFLVTELSVENLGLLIYDISLWNTYNLIICICSQ